MMFPFSNFVYLNMLSLSYSMSNETTDDCGQVLYETGCLVKSYFQALNKHKSFFIIHSNW